MVQKDEEIQDLKDNMEELLVSQEVIAARGLTFKLRCDTLEKDKVELLDTSICKGKTIKKIWEKLKYVASCQEYEDFIKVTVHNFLEGVLAWRG